MQKIIEINGKYYENGVYILLRTLNPYTKCIAIKYQWVKIRNLSGWVAFHGILPSF